MISKDLLDILACPACAERPAVKLTDDDSALMCEKCHRQYPIRDDIPVMLVDQAVLPEQNAGADDSESQPA